MTASSLLWIYLSLWFFLNFFFIWSTVCLHSFSYDPRVFCLFVFWNSRLFTATIHKKEIERTFSGEREKTKKIFLFQKRKKELKLLGENFHSFFNSQLHVGHMFFNHTVDKLGGLASTLKVWKKTKVFMKDKRKFKKKLFFREIGLLVAWCTTLSNSSVISFWDLVLWGSAFSSNNALAFSIARVKSSETKKKIN